MIHANKANTKAKRNQKKRKRELINSLNNLIENSIESGQFSCLHYFCGDADIQYAEEISEFYRAKGYEINLFGTSTSFEKRKCLIIKWEKENQNENKSSFFDKIKNLLYNIYRKLKITYEQGEKENDKLSR